MHASLARPCAALGRYPMSAAGVWTAALLTAPTYRMQNSVAYVQCAFVAVPLYHQPCVRCVVVLGEKGLLGKGGGVPVVAAAALLTPTLQAAAGGWAWRSPPPASAVRCSVICVSARVCHLSCCCVRLRAPCPPPLPPASSPTCRICRHAMVFICGQTVPLSAPATAPC